MTAVAEVGGGSLTLSGRFGTASAPTDLRIHAEDVALGALPARGVRLAGTAHIDGTVRGPRGAEQVRLHLDAEDGVIRGWNPLAEILGTAQATPGGPSDLRFQTLALDIAGPEGGWRVSGLRGRLDGIDVAAELQVAANGAIAGRGTATQAGRAVAFTITGTAAKPLIVR
jgi:autotransporter translocation and assembly factor TamB